MSIINLSLCKEDQSSIKTVGSEYRQLPAAALLLAKMIMDFSSSKWDNMLYLRIFFPKGTIFFRTNKFLSVPSYMPRWLWVEQFFCAWNLMDLNKHLGSPLWFLRNLRFHNKYSESMLQHKNVLFPCVFASLGLPLGSDSIPYNNRKYLHKSNCYLVLSSY